LLTSEEKELINKAKEKKKERQSIVQKIFSPTSPSSRLFEAAAEAAVVGLEIFLPGGRSRGGLVHFCYLKFKSKFSVLSQKLFGEEKTCCFACAADFVINLTLSAQQYGSYNNFYGLVVLAGGNRARPAPNLQGREPTLPFVPAQI